VAVPPGGDPQPGQEFESWTADLKRMAAWLKACGIETVVMQSTGVYWIALYDLLEARGFKLCLTNPRHAVQETCLDAKVMSRRAKGCSSCILWFAAKLPSPTR
jgi:transposase